MNFGLFFGGEVDAFGVTSSFDIENASIRPNMFVVADEFALRVCGEGCFACSGETEEESDVVLFDADVG